MALIRDDPDKDEETWPDPRNEKQHVIAERLIEIVETHGPMLAGYANKIYLSKVGLKKLGRNLREVFKYAMTGALRTGKVVEVANRINNDVIVKAPKQNDVIVRKIADRDFYLIPPNEIKRLAGQLKKQTVYRAGPHSGIPFSLNTRGHLCQRNGYGGRR